MTTTATPTAPDFVRARVVIDAAGRPRLQRIVDHESTATVVDNATRIALGKTCGGGCRLPAGHTSERHMRQDGTRFDRQEG